MWWRRYKPELTALAVVTVCTTIWLGAKWIDREYSSGPETSGDYLVTQENGLTVLHYFDVEASRHRARQLLEDGRLMNSRQVDSIRIDSVCVICAKERY